ncbi:MAG TPA: hypothetical protein VF844_03260 [Ktedonobacteraceae bacterium]
MSQQTIKATDNNTAPAGEISTEEHVSRREIPLPKVFVGATNTGKNACEGVASRWNELPRERQRLFALVGISVITSITMSLIATVIARFFAKRRTVAQ